jgi:hypothetical protein
MGSEWDGLDGLCGRPPNDKPWAGLVDALTGGYKPWAGCLNTLTADTSIEFTINRTPHCGVPNAQGETLAMAKKTIRSHNCRVGKVTHAASRKVKKGNVTSQKPKPGAYLRLGAQVNLVVSRGRR